MSGVLNDPQFVKLLVRLCKYKLSGREMKYLLWKFYWKMTDEQISELDEYKIKRRMVSKTLENIYFKIKLPYKKVACNT